ncbi:QRFP-like peptide receptor isoform X2 [Lineus longissimus]|uniref:QRFP-like peptide receptor isoform X2 n=1 Tax=Lineus longissimus TaxID=88925 RepID=UPI00315C7AF6
MGKGVGFSGHLHRFGCSLRGPDLGWEWISLLHISEDICVGIFAVPMEILAYYNEEFMSSALCQGLQYFVHVSLAANIYCLILIALDRHRNIVKPFLPKLRFRQCIVNILLVWFVSIVQGWSAVVLYRVEVREHVYHGQLVMRHECTIAEDQGETYLFVIWFNFLTIYVIPLGIITGLYSKIFSAFYLSRVRVGTTAQGNDQRRKRVVRMLASIVMVLAVCQFPLHVWKIYVFAGGGAFEGYLVLRQVFGVISFSNSWLNVVIYVSLNEGFRRAYRDIFGCRRPSGVDEERSRWVSGIPSASSFRPSINSVMFPSPKNADGSSGSKSSVSAFSRNLSVHSHVSNHSHLSVNSLNRQNHNNLSVSTAELPNGHLDSSV